VSHFIWTERAKAQLRQIDAHRHCRFFMRSPATPAVARGEIKKLKGGGDLRLRVGDYRVRFEVVDEDKYRILQVRHRREAYRS
jgi:mRNA-degrading endonuclease RelE of RelBE toxin-antitoxin system